MILKTSRLLVFMKDRSLAGIFSLEIDAEDSKRPSNSQLRRPATCRHRTVSLPTFRCIVFGFSGETVQSSHPDTPGR